MPASTQSSSSRCRPSCRSTPAWSERKRKRASGSRPRGFGPGREAEDPDCVLRTRSVGAAIVDEAQRRNAEVIYLDFAAATRPGFRSVAAYVLEKRPCRVVIETMGGGARPYASGSDAPEPDRSRPRRIRAGVGAG